MKTIARTVILLTLTVLFAAGASAQMYLGGDDGGFCIGTDNEIFALPAFERLVSGTVSSIEWANEARTRIIYTAVNDEGMFLTANAPDSWDEAQIIEKVACDPLYVQADGVIYYAPADQPETLCALAVKDETTRALCAADNPITGLRMSDDGLLVLTEGGEKLYDADSKRLAEPTRNLVGSKLVLFDDGLQAALSEDGDLTMSASVEAESENADTNVTAIAGGADTLYYLKSEGRKTVLYRMALNEEAPVALHAFLEPLKPFLAVSGDAACVIGRSSVLYRYDALSDAVVSLKMLGGNVATPDVQFAGDWVLVYDLSRAPGDKFVCAVDLCLIQKITPSPRPSATARPVVTPRYTPTPTPTPTPAPRSRYTTLSAGSRGDAVVRLQQALIDLGYLTGKADGHFGEATTRAIKLLQGDMDESETGKATPALQDILFNGNPPHYVEYVTLSAGDTGIRVTDLQVRLRDLYYLKYQAGGTYNQATVDAVKAYQAVEGYKEAKRITARQLKTLFSKNAPENPNYLDLEYGDKAPAVKRLARRLKKLNYLSGSVTESYNQRVYDAVFLFQSYNGLLADGIASEPLQSNMIFNSQVKPYVPEPDPQQVVTDKQVRTVKEWLNKNLKKKYNKEEAVKRLQKKLMTGGFLGSGKATEVYDQDTYDAVADFQVSVGFSPSGVADKETLKALFDK